MRNNHTEGRPGDQDFMSKVEKKLKETQELTKSIDHLVRKQIVFDGHTLDEWRRVLKVDIPSNIDVPTLIQLSIDIGKKYQTASFYRERQNFSVSILEQERAEKWKQAYDNTRAKHQQEFNKPLAAKSCEVAADLTVKEFDDAVNLQKTIQDFWNRRVSTLSELRKIVEIMSYSIGADARMQRDVNIYTKEK